jgi:hypothetical protein
MRQQNAVKKISNAPRRADRDDCRFRIFDVLPVC